MKFSELNAPVLIVDDELEILLLVEEMFKDIGLQVIKAQTGSEALKLFKEHHPFLIVSDLRMPGGDGLGLCESVRSLGDTTPFVLLTGYADKQVALDGLNKGVNCVLEKPIEYNALKQAVILFAQQKWKANEDDRLEMERITDTFIEEAREHLRDIDTLFLRLEENPGDTGLVDVLFRRIHTIKGSSGAIAGAELIAELSHEFESSLSLVKKGQMKVGPRQVDFYLKVADTLSELVESMRIERSTETVQRVKLLRESFFNLTTLSPDVATESKESSAKIDSAEAEVVLVPNEKLDALMKLCGELVVLKNGFTTMNSHSDGVSQSDNIERRLWDFQRALNRFSDNLQEQMMSIRKVSLGKALSKIQRLFRQTCQSLGKRANLKLEGFELCVDKSIAKMLSTVCTHIVRNALDHGLESEADRNKNNKNPIGSVCIRASESKGVVYFEIEDDGRGIDLARVKNKALEKGLIRSSHANSMSESDILDLIFLPGFSTAEKVTDVSGRGVGMDAVRSSVVGLGGEIRIVSTIGKGTRFLLEIPLPRTVIVEQTLVARAGAQLIAIPLVGIDSIFSADSVDIENIGPHLVMMFGNSTVRVIEMFNSERVYSNAPREGNIVVLKGKNNLLGIIVDEVVGQLEAVIRPFDSMIGSIPSFKGTTVLDEARVAYVVSPEEAVNNFVDHLHQDRVA